MKGTKDGGYIFVGISRISKNGTHYQLVILRSDVIWFTVVCKIEDFHVYMPL